MMVLWEQEGAKSLAIARAPFNVIDAQVNPGAQSVEIALIRASTIAALERRRRWLDHSRRVTTS